MKGTSEMTPISHKVCLAILLDKLSTYVCIHASIRWMPHALSVESWNLGVVMELQPRYVTIIIIIIAVNSSAINYDMIFFMQKRKVQELELVPGHGVFISRPQLDECVDDAGASPT